MTATPSLYDIRVGFEVEGDALDPFAALRNHRDIKIKLAQDLSQPHRFTREEAFNAMRWANGVIARRPATIPINSANTRARST